MCNAEAQLDRVEGGGVQTGLGESFGVKLGCALRVTETERKLRDVSKREGVAFARCFANDRGERRAVGLRLGLGLGQQPKVPGGLRRIGLQFTALFHGLKDLQRLAGQLALERGFRHVEFFFGLELDSGGLQQAIFVEFQAFG